MVSGSQDFTVKVWDLPADLAAGEDVHQLTPRTTEKAHDKVGGTHKEIPESRGINSCSVSLLRNR